MFLYHTVKIECHSVQTDTPAEQVQSVIHIANEVKQLGVGEGGFFSFKVLHLIA